MRGLMRRLSEVLRPGGLDREAADELAHHLELLVEQKVARGLDPREARRQAILEAGSPTWAREEVAAGRTGAGAARWWRDLRDAHRVLRRTPGVSLLSVATMSVGIGASVLLFALVDGIVLRPLPYPDPDRLVRIFDVNPEAGVDRAGAASGNLADWRRSGAFDGLAGYYSMGRTVSDSAGVDVLITAQVTEQFFETMGVAPALGRTFTADEVRRATFNSAAAPTGADPVVILSHGTWVERFGADPAAIGRRIILDRRSFEIVGVMPRRFEMPDATVKLWIPWSIRADAPRDQHYLGAVARLAAGLDARVAEARVNEVARLLGETHPATNRGWRVRLSSLADETTGPVASVLWLLVSAVGLLLVVACASVALLALMRGIDRRDEVAVRLALGAPASRVVRSFLLESTLLAAAGGVLGAALASAGLRVLRVMALEVPRLGDVSLDGRALAFVAVVAAAAGVLTGLPQAWRGARVLPIAALGAGSVRATESADRHWLRDGIVVLHVALAVILLTGAGLVTRSVRHLSQTDQGFDPRGVLVAPIFLDNATYTGEKTRAYYGALFDALSALPGVSAVGGATSVPSGTLGPSFDRPVWRDDTHDSAMRTPAAVRMVPPGLFAALGLRIAAGRAIDDRDHPSATPVLMVTESLARRLWPGQDAVGRRLVVDYSTAGTYTYDVIGVVGDFRAGGPRSDPRAEIFLPHAQRSYLIMNVVIKTAGDPRALVPAVRKAIASVDSMVPAHGLHPLEDLVGATFARDRQVMLALTVFAAASVLLALLSVYGVVSQRVRERTREIGIRMALGGSASRVAAWAARSGLRLIALGLFLGLFASQLLAGSLEGRLVGVATTDVATLGGVVVSMMVLGLLAALVPSWRATRVDPVLVLRRG